MLFKAQGNHMRFVHINGVPWKYNIGKSYINIWHPVTKKRVNILHKEVVPYSSDDVVPIGPGDIKLYIENKILRTVPVATPKEKRNPEKQPLTITKMRRRVEEFLTHMNSDTCDNEILHGREDFLMKLFIRHVATCKDCYADDLRKMAQELVKVIDTKYERWYS